MDPPSPVHLPIRVDADGDRARLDQEAMEIARRVRPAWRDSRLRVRHFTDGITNRLVGVSRADGEDGEEDMLLVRVYGAGSHLFIDRRSEKHTMLRLSARRLAPPLFASFENGLCYAFAPGSPLDVESVREPRVARLVARHLARVHLALTPDAESGCWLLPALTRLVDALPGEGEGEEAPLRREVAFLARVLPPLGSAVRFCHNDLLLANIVVREESVTFIDYEYAGFNWRAFDIANHWCEWAGVEGYDDARFPSRETQRAWLRDYLAASEEEAGEAAVESLLRQVDAFVPAAHLLWSLWARVQALHSRLSFDFARYARLRMTQYARTKAAHFH